MALIKSLSFSLGRKRILISDHSCKLKHFRADFECFTPMATKKLRVSEMNLGGDIESNNSTSFLECLPQELLIKIVCGVDHDDLKQLFFVSKTVRDVAAIAKNCHFAYSTPSKTKAIRNSTDMLNSSDNSTNFEPPKAPKPSRKLKRRRLDWRKLDKIATELFSDETVKEELQGWPRRSLFMDIDG